MAAPTNFEAGQLVEASDDGAWVKAKLLEKREDGKWKVLFTKYKQEGIKTENKLRRLNVRSKFMRKVHDRQNVEAQRQQTVSEMEEERRQKAELADAKKNEGNGYLKTGDFDNAVGCYSQAISLNPSNHIYYGNRAQGYLKLAEYDLAIEDCNKALSIDSTFVKAYIRRGWAKKPTAKTYQDVKNMEADFRKALELDAKNATAKRELAIIKKRLKKNKKKKKRETLI